MSGMTMEERMCRLESIVGQLSIRVEQYARTGVADAENFFYCIDDFDEAAECRKWDGVFGPLIR